MKNISSINEFWGDVLKRDLLGETREEDKTAWDRWIETVHWVDMGNGIFITEENLPGLEDKHGNEFTGILKSDNFTDFLNKNGVDIIDADTMNDIVNNVSVVFDNNRRYIKSNITDETIEITDPIVCTPFAISNDGNRTIFRIGYIGYADKFDLSNKYFYAVSNIKYVVKLMKRMKK